MNKIRLKVMAVVRRLLRETIRATVAIPVSTLLMLLWPVLKVRVLVLYSARIGHLIWNLENYQAHLRGSQGRSVNLVLLDRHVANSAILNVIKPSISALFVGGRVARAIRHLTASRFFRPFVVPFEVVHPQFSTVSLTPAIVRVEEDEISRTLRLAEIPAKPYVVFHNRDPAYLTAIGDDGNNHDFRDFGFEMFSTATRSLAQLGLSSVRIGTLTAESLTEKHLYDFSDRNSREEFDLPLVAGAEFFVSGNSGVAQLSTLLRKPHLYINYLPIRLDHLSSFSAGSVVVPCLLEEVSSGRLLSIQEIAEVCAKWTIHYRGDFFRDRGLKIRQNSRELIEKSVLEMLERCQGRSSETETALDYAELSAKVFGKSPQARWVFSQLGVRFGEAFLQMHPDLLK